MNKNQENRVMITQSICHLKRKVKHNLKIQQQLETGLQTQNLSMQFLIDDVYPLIDDINFRKNIATITNIFFNALIPQFPQETQLLQNIFQLQHMNLFKLTCFTTEHYLTFNLFNKKHFNSFYSLNTFLQNDAQKYLIAKFLSMTADNQKICQQYQKQIKHYFMAGLSPNTLIFAKTKKRKTNNIQQTQAFRFYLQSLLRYHHQKATLQIISDGFNNTRLLSLIKKYLLFMNDNVTLFGEANFFKISPTIITN